MADKPAQKPRGLRVNLLHPQGEPLRLPQRFLSWLLNYGRFIILAVEIIVIGAFLLRFKLDSDIASLNRQISGEVANIQAHAQDQAIIVQTQQKLKLTKQTYDATPDWQTIFNSITNKIPSGITFSNFNLEHAQNSPSLNFKIVAKTNSNLDVSAFINALKESDKDEKDRKFRGVTLSNVTFEQGVISFTVTGSTK